MNRARHAAWIASAALTLGALAGASAQDDGARGPDRDPAPAGARQPDPERVRAFLERQRERLASQQSRVERALSMLDDGATVEEVRRFMDDDRPARPMADRVRERQRDGRPAPGRGGPGPEGAGRGGPGAGPAREMPPEVRTFLEEEYPRMLERLDRLREQSPDRFADAWRRTEPRVRRLMEGFRRDPEGARLREDLRLEESRARSLARRYWASDEAERPAIEASLREAVEAQFDMTVELFERRIATLEGELAEARRRLAETATDRDRLLETRTDDFLLRAGPEATTEPSADGDGPAR